MRKLFAICGMLLMVITVPLLLAPSSGGGGSSSGSSGGTNGLSATDLKNALLSGTNQLKLTNATPGSLKPAALSTDFMPNTNVMTSTNLDVAGDLNKVPVGTGTTNQFGAATFIMKAYNINNMAFNVRSNAFTNNIVGYLLLTNADGLIFSIAVGTNMP